MAKKLVVLFLIVFAGLVITISSCGNNTTKAKTNSIELKVLELDNGKWAYTIEVEGKPYIHQTRIPAIKGNYPFETKDDALKIGNMVVEKMKKTPGDFPALTEEEIKSLNLTGL